MRQQEGGKRGKNEADGRDCPGFPRQSNPENYILAVDFLGALVDFLEVLVDLVVDLSAAKVAVVRPRMRPRPMAMLAIFFIVLISP